MNHRKENADISSKYMKDVLIGKEMSFPTQIMSRKGSRQT